MGDEAYTNNRAWKRQFAMLLCVQVSVSTAHGIFVPLLPGYLQDIGGLSPEQVIEWSGVIFAANFISMMLAMPLLGRIGDRFGRKPVMLWSGFGMAVVTAMMALAHQPAELAALRFVQGCFTGILPFSMVLVVTGAPKARVGVAAGTMQMMGELGAVIGPLIGTLLLSFWSARLVLPAMGALIMTGTLFVLLGVREPARPAVSAPPQSLAKDWRAIWRTVPFPQLMFTSFCINFALVGTNPILPFYVREAAHPWWSSSVGTGIALAATSLAVIASAAGLGRLADRFGPLRLLKAATAAAAVLCVVQAAVPIYGVFLACRLLLGVCVAAMMPNVQVHIRQYVQPGMETRTFGITNAWMFFGSLSGPICSGLLTSRLGPAGWFASIGIVFAVSCWQAFRIGRLTDAARVRIDSGVGRVSA